MEENVVIKITTDAEMSDAELEIKRMQSAYSDLQKKLDAEIKTERELKQTLGESSAAAQKVIKESRDLQKAYDEQMKAMEKNISTLKKNVNSYNLLNNSGQALRQKVRALREEIMELEMAGKTGSQRFMDLSVEAARLQDQMGDTQRQIQILASDTANLDAVMSAGSGLVGAFNAATSAAALLGGESEELQRAFLKVQAAMAVLNGVQQVANALNKDSAARVVLRTALAKVFRRETEKNTVATLANAGAEGVYTTATDAATKSTMKFTTALMTNPVFAIIAAVAALAAGVYLLATRFSASARKQRAAENAMKDYNKTLVAVTHNLGIYKNNHEVVMRDIEKREQEATNALTKRHATTLEQQRSELKFQQERLKAITDYTNKAIPSIQNEVKAAKEAYDAANDYTKLTKVGSKERKEALEKENEAQQAYYDALSKQREMVDLYNNAKQSVIDTEQAIADERLAIQQKLQQSRLNLMHDGIEKELAQVELNYSQQLREVQKGTDLYNSLVDEKKKEETAIRRKYNLQATATMLQELKNESAAHKDNLELKKIVFEEEAKYKRLSLDKQKMSKEEYAAQEEAIEIELQENLRSIRSEEITNDIAEQKLYYTQLQNLAEESAKQTLATRQQAKDARDGLLDLEEEELNERYKNREMTEQKYNARLEEINHQRVMNEIADEQEKTELIRDMTSELLSFISDMSSEIFGAIVDNINDQIEALDEMYTTDAEEAEANADKKYISEKELETKKAALKRKAAAYEKAQSLFSIALSTAQAIMSIWADPSALWAMKIALSATAATLGATQLAIAAAKPLPKYAKGRKGGAGEFAMVGERGAEIMYIPQGASIIPHNKINDTAAWSDFGIPKLAIPDLPNVDAHEYFATSTSPLDIDYNRLGEVIAHSINIPTPQPVSVNIDRDGISVSKGTMNRKYLNTKYTGSWQ